MKKQRDGEAFSTTSKRERERLALGLSVKKSQACAELEAQNAGDGRAGSEVDAAFEARAKDMI